MSVVLSESDIPGSSLNGRNPSELKNDQLRFWLNAAMIPPKVYAKKPNSLSGKLVLFDRCMHPFDTITFEINILFCVSKQ